MTYYDAIDLFAGAGGWSVAMDWLGWNEVGIELDPTACRTRGHAGFDTIQKDSRQVHVLNNAAPGLIASPPCQTFSATGTGTGRSDMSLILEALRVYSWEGDWSDERTGLILEPLRWIMTRLRNSDPFRWIAMEQVPACIPIWESYCELLRDFGYDATCGIVHAEQHGVPQTRKRAVLVASLDRPADLPTPYGDHMIVAMQDALPERKGFRQRSNYSSGSSANGTSYTARGPGIRNSDQPAFTITGKGFNWLNSEGDRTTATPRDMAILQSFPSSYPWQGNITQQRQQIGNACPPLMAYAILNQLIGHKP